MENRITIEEAYNKAIEYEAKTQVIGIQKEKILHRTLKYFLCRDDTYHEVKVPKATKGCLYADIKIDDTIYEIQTRSFNALREKLDVFLQQYQVTIVYPIAYHKTIFQLDEHHCLLSQKKSPKKGNPLEIFYELYKIKPYLKHPHLSFQIILIDMDEYRQRVAKKHFRSSGYIRQVQIPRRVERIIHLSHYEEYIQLLDEYQLPETFISTDFAKATHLTIKKAMVTLHVLTHIGILTRIGKRKQNYIYKRKDRKGMN